MSLSAFSAFQDRQDRQDRLEQLIYVSVAAIRVNSALQMADILATARPNNTRDGITGVLTAVDGRFVQVIEGVPDALERLLSRLAADDRHRGIAVLERRDIRARAFPEWDMVSPRLAVSEAQAVAALMADEQAALDDYIPVLSRALGRQAALIEGAGLDHRSGSAPYVPPDSTRTGRGKD